MNLIGISGKMRNGKDTVANIIEYLSILNRKEGTIGWSKEKLEGYIINGNFDFSKLHFRWETKSFALKLKQIVSILTGLPMDTFKSQEGKLMELDSSWDYYTLEYFVEKDATSSIKRTNTKGEMEDFISTFSKWRKDSMMEKVIKEQLMGNIIHHKMTVREMLQLVGTDCMRDNLHQNVWVNSLFADYKQNNNWLITDTRFLNEAKAIKDRGGIILRVERDIDSNNSTHISETALDNYEFDYIIYNNGTIRDLIEEVEKFLKHYNII